MKNILIVGGAGYVGSHAVADLIENGYNPVVYDNLTEGHIEAAQGAPFVQGDINNTVLLKQTMQKYSISAVMHFSAYAYVGESVTNPQKYYLNNVSATLNLLSAMLEMKIKKIIFSSTCATYGNPVYTPIDEKHPQNPINPYGASKVMVERILDDYSHAYGLQYAALRYFNAAGAHPKGHIGESHRIETHLIPLILKTLTGENQNIKIFGTDYDTTDGTCVRDYIHVCDLAVAHRQALEKIASSDISYKINLGTGIGNSVREVIQACEEVTGLKVPVIEADKRPGDPPFLVASNSYAKEVLNFNPIYTNINDTIKTAWNWETNRKY